MNLLRIMLAVTSVSSVGYAVGLLVPGLFPAPEMAPDGILWPRYLVPIYVGLAAMAWLGLRRPEVTIPVAWTFVLVWAGLVLTHIVNLTLGDEIAGPMTLGLLVFDASMGGLLLLGILRAAPGSGASPEP